MYVMKFKNNTIICGCTKKITLIYGVIKLNYGIKLEYCKDCAYGLLQILGVTSLITQQLNWSHTQFVCV